jgi:UDP-N-acetylglucosamine diphosphorylase / glucose-1-phosphate thymidylyltransferase / UDP-N-acetylgalactosamine diphosphorylase / glucosamine-1-phosphate N-acetyltransferase / galactosamine-1-phosphate N-acetyltransferase
MSDRLNINDYINGFEQFFPGLNAVLPWHITRDLQQFVGSYLSSLNSDYMIKGDVAIHKDAIVEEGVTLKGPIIIAENVFIGAHAYLRSGVFLAPKVSIGPGCEIKTSIVMNGSALAHFNFVGDSIIGTGVNMEAGSVIANHHNDRQDKTIFVRTGGNLIKTDVMKFGALIGDNCKIGANAVLSPGTILVPEFIVRRLELIDQQ